MSKIQAYTYRSYCFKVISAISIIVCCITVFSGCGIMQNSKTNGAELHIAAASDLYISFTQLGKQFENITQCKVHFTYGSTGTLTQQIIHGAPFDVLAAAHESYIQDLEQHDLVFTDTIESYAQGRIGWAIQSESPLVVREWMDLLHPSIRKIAIAQPQHAPYGLAAQQALQTAGIWDQVLPKLVYGTSVLDTLNYVTTGNADIGIIAQSIGNQPGISFQLLDASYHQPLNQTIAVVNTSLHEELARDFVDYVMSEEGQQLLASYGFDPPAKGSSP